MGLPRKVKVASNPGGSLSEIASNATNLSGPSRVSSVPSGLNNWQPARESNFMNSKTRSTRI